MRYPRRSIVPNSGAIVHKIWRFHNRTFGLEGDSSRSLFLKSTWYALKHRAIADKIRMSAFCVMNNHSHQLIHSRGETQWLSKFMQIALTKFARIYNDLNKRTGAVGNGRPKTIPIQGTDSALIRTHMYIEANPIRAGFRKVENLRMYKFSSYRFYAHGETDEHTEGLEPPSWYIAMGATPLARQRAYRSLFKRYTDPKKAGPSSWPKMGELQFFGELSWVYESLRELRKSVMRTENQTSHHLVEPGGVTLSGVLLE